MQNLIGMLILLALTATPAFAGDPTNVLKDPGEVHGPEACTSRMIEREHFCLSDDEYQRAQNTLTLSLQGYVQGGDLVIYGDYVTCALFAELVELDAQRYEKVTCEQ